MNFYAIPEKSCVVGWSEKCGCTTVCDWLVNGIIRPDSPIEKKHREYLHTHNYVCPPKDALANIFDKGYTPILFARDPLTRIESAFLNKFVYRNGKPLKDESVLESFAQRVIKDCYANSGYTGEYKGISLVELLNYVKDNLNDDKIVNGHWAPQAMNFKDKSIDLKSELVKILKGRRFLVKQESFNHDLKNVNCGLGINYIPEHKNVTTAPVNWRPRLNFKADFGRMSSCEILNAKINMPKKRLLTSEVQSLVKEIYADDYAIFSYPVPVVESQQD